MTKTALLLSAAAALGLAVAAPLTAAAPRLTPEEQLAKALEGRVAGKPVRCIDPRLNSDTQVIDKTAIIYGKGRTIYVQRPTNADWLRYDDVLVQNIWGGGRICNLDIVRLHDRINWWNRGFVGLNEFVPYTRQPAATAN